MISNPYFRNTTSELHFEITNGLRSENLIDFSIKMKMSAAATYVFNKFCRNQFSLIGTEIQRFKGDRPIGKPFHVLDDPGEHELEIWIEYSAGENETVHHVAKSMHEYRRMIMRELKNLLDPFKEKESIFRDALENYLAIAQLTHESNPEKSAGK